MNQMQGLKRILVFNLFVSLFFVFTVQTYSQTLPSVCANGVVIGDETGTSYECRSLVDCYNIGSEKILYDADTNSFSCADDQRSVDNSLSGGTLTDGNFCVYDSADSEVDCNNPSINDTELANEDFGAFTCTGDEDGCTLDTTYLESTDIDTFSEIDTIVADETLVNTNDSQTLTNKTINTSDNTITINVADIADQNAGTDITADLEEEVTEGSLANDVILEEDLRVVDTPLDEECLTYEVTTGDFEWQACDIAAIITNGSDGDSTTIQADSGLESISGELTMLRGCADNEILKWDEAQDNWNCNLDATAAGGSAIILDLADDESNESDDLIEIAIVGDTNSIFSEDTASKLLITLSNNWPGADQANQADALAANGANCSAGQYPLGVDASGAVESCTADDDTPEAGDFGAATDLDSDGRISRRFSRCFAANNLVETDDDIGMGSWFEAVTITDVWCHYRGIGTTTAQISLEDGEGNEMTHTTATCTAHGTQPTAQSITAGGSLVAREVLRFDVDNIPDPTTDDYEICVAYTF